MCIPHICQLVFASWAHLCHLNSVPYNEGCLSDFYVIIGLMHRDTFVSFPGQSQCFFSLIGFVLSRERICYLQRIQTQKASSASLGCFRNIKRAWTETSAIKTTPQRCQSKTFILSMNVDQKFLETEFSIAICRLNGDKWQLKTLFLAILDPRLSLLRAFSIAPYLL